MEIRIPEWAHTIKDEGALTFLAFVHRITDIYGEDGYYSINIEDLIKMCNKRGNGLVGWLRRFKVVDENIEFGEPFDGVVVFKYKRLQARAATMGRTAAKQAYTVYELQDMRQQMVWMYLLGCFNNNIITKDDNNVPHWQNNTAGIKWFHLTREAKQYIKLADRCEEEN